ncbi:MAG: phage portal protein [Faecousia sp.]
MLSLRSASGWNLESGGVDASLKVSAVYRAVTFSAQTISVMPFYIMDRKTRERVVDHPLLSILTIRPNECMTPSEYKSLMETNRLLNGNGYAYIRRSDRTGRVSELLPLSPDLVNIWMDEERHLHYLYTDPISGRLFHLLPNQVIHYKAFTLDGVLGISPLAYARDVITKDRAAKAYERALYNNGGRPSGVLQTDADLSGIEIVKDADGNEAKVSKKELVRRAWEKVHAGSDNAFRTAVLDLGLKYQPISSMSNADAQFVESNDITIADIARFFGVPLHVLMSGKQSYESNEQNRVEYVQTTALSTVTACEEEDSFKLLSSMDQEKEYRIRRNMDAALRGDAKSRAEFYKTMHEIGAYSVNNILAKEDEPDVSGGDVRLASLNYVPLEDFQRLSDQRNGV